MTGQKRPPLPNLYRGFSGNCLSIVPTEAIAFLVHGVAIHSFGESPLTVSFAAGAVSAPVATAFERIVIVQQLEGRSCFKSIHRLFVLEGTRGFLKGLAPMTLRESLFTGALFGFNRTFEKNQALTSFAAGGFAGFLSTPADRIKTLMQADLCGHYPSFITTAKKIVLSEGFAALFKGATIRSSLIGAATLIMSYSKEQLPLFFPAWTIQKKD